MVVNLFLVLKTYKHICQHADYTYVILNVAKKKIPTIMANSLKSGDAKLRA